MLKLFKNLDFDGLERLWLNSQTSEQTVLIKFASHFKNITLINFLVTYPKLFYIFPCCNHY